MRTQRSSALSPDYPRLDRTGAQRSLTTRAKLRLLGRAHAWARDRGAGSIHDLTQVRQAGLVELLALVPGVTLLADAGYQGLSTQTAGAVITPRPARRRHQLPVFPAVAAAHEAERQAHSAQRIRVEHLVDRRTGYLRLVQLRRRHLRTAGQPVAARHQREHQSAGAPVPAQGQSMAHLTQDDLDATAAKLNTRSRKTLDFDTLADRLAALLR